MGKSREKWLLAAMLGLLVLAGLFAAPRRRAGDGDYRLTTHSPGPEGARALYLTLERVGVKVGRRETAYVGADSLPPRVLALLAPSQDPGDAEWEALDGWMRRGGTLLYVASGRGDAVLDSLGLAIEGLASDSLPGFGGDRWEGENALSRPHPALQGVAGAGGFRLAFADTSRALRGRAAAPLLVTPGGEAVAVEMRRGKGRVIAFADRTPFTNDALRASDVAPVFARTAAWAARGDTVWFDEYHHGFSQARGLGGGMGTFLRTKALGHALLQLGAVGLLLLLFHARRFGSPLPSPTARRRSPLEHVEALAGAYRQAGARRTARRLVVAGLARRLGRRPPRDDRAEAELLERLAAHPRAGPAAAAARGEWEKGRGADLVALSRDVDRILTEVRRK